MTISNFTTLEFFTAYAKRRYDFSVANFGLDKDHQALATVAFGVLEELGEVIEVVETALKISWLDGKLNEVYTTNFQKQLTKEIGDTLCYMGVILNQLDANKDEIDNVTCQYRDHLIQFDHIRYQMFDINELTEWNKLATKTIRENLGLSKRLMRGDASSRKDYIDSLTVIYSLCVSLAPLSAKSLNEILEDNERKLDERLQRKTLKGTGSNR